VSTCWFTDTNVRNIFWAGKKNGIYFIGILLKTGGMALIQGKDMKTVSEYQ